jgi:alcohol dehydrogenase (NADP+)
LHPGVKLPSIGFGCSPYRPDGSRVDLEPAVRLALSLGYRLLDVAEMYGNERAVGRALRTSGVPRDRLVVVGKAWRTSFAPAHLERACAGSLSRLGLDAFDLYLLHAPEAWRHQAPLADVEDLGWEEFRRRAFADGSPDPQGPALAETWAGMQRLVERGLARAVGVSNFSPAELARLGAPPPIADQIEHHPYAPQPQTVRFCQDQGIALLAHSPLSAPGLLADPRLAAVAAAAGRTVAQVVLRWNIQRGLVPLPSSRDARHIAENLLCLDFALDAAALARIDAAGGAASAP